VNPAKNTISFCFRPPWVKTTNAAEFYKLHPDLLPLFRKTNKEMWSEITLIGKKLAKICKMYGYVMYNMCKLHTKTLSCLLIKREIFNTRFTNRGYNKEEWMNSFGPKQFSFLGNWKCVWGKEISWKILVFWRSSNIWWIECFIEIFFGIFKLNIYALVLHWRPKCWDKF